MNEITLYQPNKIVFGINSLQKLPEDSKEDNIRKILFITASPLKKKVEELIVVLKNIQIEAELLEYVFGEPTIAYFNSLLEPAKAYCPDCVVGIGGGSVLDTAKLIASLIDKAQDVRQFFGKNLLPGRNTKLVCVPTTSGTGSEVSPNAILLDENTLEKIGTISPFLVPDVCYIDPSLTVGLPPSITAETAMDALSHCIEAYTNKFSHPVVDNYALAGIRLITQNLETAYENGNDLEARSALSLGSMYGGLCLGPVNTAAVHALSYGLGGKYHISHGLANAILLPGIMKFNMESDVERYRQVALATGIEEADSPEETALKGIEKISEIAIACGIPQKLSDINVRQEDVEELSNLAMNVTRLLVNNPREVKKEDAMNIFNSLF